MFYSVPERKFINQQYLSNELVLTADTYHITCIKSPIGTGKTEFAVNLVHFLEAYAEKSLRVLVITHRVALVHNIVERYKVFKSYDEIDRKEIPHTQKLVITINSLYKVIKYGNPLPEYDLIIIDEFQQVLWSFFSDTFKNDAGLRNMSILKGLIIRAKSVVVMDAHLDEISENWLQTLCRKNYVYQKENLEPGMIIIDNQFRPQKGDLQYYPDEAMLVKRIEELVDLNEGPVVIATMLKKTKELQKLLQKRISPEEIMVINSDSRFNDRERMFVNNINTEITNYRAVLYSPSLGSGVDIQTKVRAVIGIFKVEPLDHTEIMQMMGRCRHAQETFLHIRPSNPNYPIDPSVIYKHYEEKTMQLAFTGTYNASGYFKVAGEQDIFCELYSLFEAKRHMAKNDLVDAVLQLASREYRIISQDDRADEKERGKQLTARTELKEEFMLMVLGLEDELSPEAYHQLAENGTQTEETRAMLIRYIIHYLFGEVTRETYDDYGGYDGTGLTQLIFHADLFRMRDYLRQQDKKRLARQTAMHKLENRLGRAEFMLKTLEHFWGNSFTPDTVFTKSELEKLMEAYLKKHMVAFKEITGWKLGRYSSKPERMLSLILNRIGLKLYCHTRGQHRDKYGLEADSFRRWIQYASRLADMDEQAYEVAVELSKTRV